MKCISKQAYQNAEHGGKDYEIRELLTYSNHPHVTDHVLCISVL